jgi:hypothetical protein
MLAQCICFGYRIGEVSCPTKYFAEASSINFSRSVKYGFGVLLTTLKCSLQRMGLVHYRQFSPKSRAVTMNYYKPVQSLPPAEREAKTDGISKATHA